jgi:hypothetical protein
MLTCLNWSAWTQTRWPQILAFLHTGITNAGSEGTNRVIKPSPATPTGFRNPVNQRLKNPNRHDQEGPRNLNPR